MSPWSQYNVAILAILDIVKKTVPLTGVERRRIDEAEELVDAIIDIIALEEAADEEEAPDSDDDEFIALQ
jgi:hypothetical protein